MINWISVVGNSFWIAGLALILAGLSYYYWLAGHLNHSVRQELSGHRFQRIVVLGLLLVGIGMVLTAGSVWQILPAVALILVCLLALFGLLRDRQNRYPGG